MNPAAVAERCDRARAAQGVWQGLPVARRLDPVRAFRHRLADECDSLCAAVARDVGKPTAETLGGEVLPLADAAHFLERHAGRILRPRRVSRPPLLLWGERDAVHRRPRGVVAVIGTWNYPLFLNGVQILQALVAGNAVVWKPSELAPVSADSLAELIRGAGFPADLVQVLEATREGGPALIEGPIDHVVFTGAASTGRHIARRLGERLISSTLELSGCDPQFVLDDADVALAARAAWFGATLNRGQTCLAVRRALVQRPAYPAFCAALAGLASGAAPVSLALASQAEQARRLVADALERGGRLLGDKTSQIIVEGAHCRPAVVADARPEMALWAEASFAPLLAVLPFDRDEEAVRLDAVCPYHLGASIFTNSRPRAEALAAALGSGTVAVNDVVVPIAHPATPFGGRGASGWGVTQGEEGLLEMTIPQVVSRRGGRFRPHYDLAPGPATAAKLAAQEELLRGMIEAGHAAGWGRRWRGWWRLLRALGRGV